MKTIIAILSVVLMISCSKSDSSNPTPPPAGGVAIKQASVVSFELSDASGYPTRMYANNSNTGETFFVFDKNPSGTYSVSFHGLGGRPIAGTPRAGATNLVAFDPGVNDTLIVSNNGIETMRVILINDNLNILNGCILVDRKGIETNAQAGIRLNNYVANIMPTQKFRPF
jgi:hypothetical protein